jgi:indole-3-glycerol phosphate synthase
MLDDIVRYKIEETRQKQTLLSEASLQARALGARPPRDFTAALRQPRIGVIAEIKYRSPSKGLLRADFDPAELALTYRLGGAAAISVLADNRFFGGGPHVVRQVANLPALELPVMYKDFVVDAYQVHEARACGADAVLLIARIQSPQKLSGWVSLIHELGMAALVECFDERDVAVALEGGARIVGINNRDLDTFEVDFDRTERLRRQMPGDVIAVSESGITSRDDMLAMQRLGFHAALIGEAIIGSPQPAIKIAHLLGR